MLFSSFGRKISRLSGIYRNARMLLHAFPLFSTSSSSFTVRGPLWGTSGCNFACLFVRSFCLLVSLANCRLFGDFLNVLFGEKNRKVRVQNNI